MQNYIIRSEVNKRENNEDSFLIFSLIPAFAQTPLTVLAIADGMGGYAHGEEVSREALRKFSLVLFEELTIASAINCLESDISINNEQLSSALMNAIEQANAYVRRMVETNKWGKAGSTIVVATILADQVTVVNLGDSPLFHWQASSGKLTQVTEDHTVAGVLWREGIITTEMAKYHEGRNQLEFYLGCNHLPKDEPLYNFKLGDGDLILLCSDGINGSILLEEIKSILASNPSLDTMAEQLIFAGKSKGETDNQTLILWRYQGEKTAVNNKTVIQGLKTINQRHE